MSEDEWVHVGTLHRTGKGVDLQRSPGGEQRAVQDLLAASGHGDALDQDVRIDLTCGRNDELDSWLVVSIRKTPSARRPKKKPRHSTPNEVRDQL